nr:mechanosensitive ion channel family protein [Methanoculleus thermophilus]
MAFNVTEILDSSIGVGNITLGNVLYFAIALIIGVIVAKVVSINARRLLAERLPKNESELLTKLIYYIIILWAFVIALPQLSFDLSGLLVAGGVAGLVIGFASQSVVSNLISGLFLMFERPIKLGDNVNIAGINGIVEDIRVLSTALKTYDGIYVRIPNEKAFTSNITNYVNNPARRFTYQIPIRYKDDVDAAIRITKEVIAAHPFALKNPAPMVFLDSIGD